MYLDVGFDIAIRNHLFHPSSFQHPAKMHLGLLQWLIERYTQPGDTIADPMAGTGSLLLAATLQRNVILRELEHEWFAILQQNSAYVCAQGALFVGTIDCALADAKQEWGYSCDHIIFSPPYGCAASATKTAKGILSKKERMDAQGGIAYSDRWNRLLNSPGAAGAFAFHYGTHEEQIGHLRKKRYYQAMEQVYRHAYTALRPGGMMILVIKDHIFEGKHIPVADTTVGLCESLGFRSVDRHQRLVHPLSLWQRRRKEQGFPIIEVEDVLVLQKEIEYEQTSCWADD